MNGEICGNCKHCIPCKELVNKEWRWFYICDLFAHEKYGFALVVEEDGLCEEFCEVE